MSTRFLENANKLYRRLSINRNTVFKNNRNKKKECGTCSDCSANTVRPLVMETAQFVEVSIRILQSGAATHPHTHTHHVRSKTIATHVTCDCIQGTHVAVAAAVRQITEVSCTRSEVQKPSHNSCPTRARARARARNRGSYR